MKLSPDPLDPRPTWKPRLRTAAIAGQLTEPARLPPLSQPHDLLEHPTPALGPWHSTVGLVPVYGSADPPRLCQPPAPSRMARSSAGALREQPGGLRVGGRQHCEQRVLGQRATHVLRVPVAEVEGKACDPRNTGAQLEAVIDAFLPDGGIDAGVERLARDQQEHGHCDPGRVCREVEEERPERGVPR
eukprot:scaffold19245_cov118-Isochrysis_galbana.AAC.2